MTAPEQIFMQKNSQSPFQDLRGNNYFQVKVIAEKMYSLIFDRKENKVTEEGAEMLKRARVLPQNILIRHMDEFREEYQYEEIAKVHYDHYRQKRTNLFEENLLKLHNYLLKGEDNSQFQGLFLPYTNTLVSREGQTRSQVGSMQSARQPNYSKDLLDQGSNYTQLRAYNKSIEGSLFKASEPAQKKKQSITIANSLSKVTRSQATLPTIQVNKRQFNIKKDAPLQNQNFPGRPLQGNSEGDELPQEEERLRKSELGLNNGKKDKAKSLGKDSFEKFMRVRELAEERAREQIEKLNQQIAKQKQKEQLANELKEENDSLKRRKAQKQNKRARLVKNKADQLQYLNENKNFKQFRQQVKEIDERQNAQLAKLKLNSMREYNRNNSQQVIDRRHSHESSQSPTSVLLVERSIDLIDRKVREGRERSLQSILEIAERPRRNEKDALESHQQQLQTRKSNQLIKILNKETRHQKLIMDQKEEYQCKLEHAKEKQTQKQHQIQEIQALREAKQKKANKLFLKQEKIKENSISESRQAWHVEGLKKVESNKLRMMDHQETYQEVLEVQVGSLKQRRENRQRIIERHLEIQKQVESIKANQQLNEDLRLKQNEEKRRFMEMRGFRTPYEDMKYKHFKQSVPLQQTSSPPMKQTEPPLTDL